MTRFLLRTGLFCCLVCVLIQSVNCFAAGQRSKVPSASTPEGRPANSKSIQARVRLWKASDDTGILQICLVPDALQSGAKPTVLSVNAQNLEFANYRAVPVGTGRVEITLDGQAPVRLPVSFANGGDFTILVQVRNGKIHARWINDTPVAEEDGASFNVYNLLPGNGGDVQVLLGDAVTVHITMAGGSSRTGGLKAAVYAVTVSGKDNEGKPFRWNTEADLKKNHHSTLLICPDPYGRIRPRLLEDSQVMESITSGVENR